MGSCGNHGSSALTLKSLGCFITDTITPVWVIVGFECWIDWVFRPGFLSKKVFQFYLGGGAWAKSPKKVAQFYLIRPVWTESKKKVRQFYLIRRAWAESKKKVRQFYLSQENKWGPLEKIEILFCQESQASKHNQFNTQIQRCLPLS